MSEAWLNRAGTKIAVVWKPETKAKARLAVAKKLKGATEINGKSRSETVPEFLSGNGWYRGADVDRLSEEEAEIIAARLVRRVQAKTTLAHDNAQGLRRCIASALRTRSIDQTQSGVLNSDEGLRQLVSQYLENDQIAILKEAIASGLRPLANEK